MTKHPGGVKLQIDKYTKTSLQPKRAQYLQAIGVNPGMIIT